MSVDKKKLPSYGSVEQSSGHYKAGFVNAGLDTKSSGVGGVGGGGGGDAEPAPPTDNPTNPFLDKPNTTATNPFKTSE